MDPAHGNDDVHHATTTANTRTRAASVVGSFKTIAAAVAAARDARTSASQPVHIVLKGGTHFVGETIQITAEDSCVLAVFLTVSLAVSLAVSLCVSVCLCVSVSVCLCVCVSLVAASIATKT